MPGFFQLAGRDIRCVTVRGLAGPMNDVYGALAFIIATAILAGLRVQLLKDRNAPCPMTKDEMSLFNMVQKLTDRGPLERSAADAVTPRGRKGDDESQDRGAGCRRHMAIERPEVAEMACLRAIGVSRLRISFARFR